MSPLTHLLASWIVAVKTTDNLRDRRLVTLAGVAPDVDGLGIILDIADGAVGRGQAYFYPQYHHWLAHGLPAAILCAWLMSEFGRRRGRVFWLALLTFHLHLLCDFLGSRGPDKWDLWPIYYFGPISRHPMWMWEHQWRLDGWQNMALTFALLVWAMGLAIRHGDSVVGVFNRRCDQIFMGVMRRWYAKVRGKEEGTLG